VRISGHVTSTTEGRIARGGDVAARRGAALRGFLCGRKRSIGEKEARKRGRRHGPANDVDVKSCTKLPRSIETSGQVARGASSRFSLAQIDMSVAALVYTVGRKLGADLFLSVTSSKINAF